ncbi:hypothetical protein GCM10023314_02880 [Algibacter agarivorans]|uniref:HTH luxR-type domain-containing protein n=1 Tax=Algibacter agarivorans TaxID=1109741 RepID=A0ABP9G9C2_9FLAO
MDSKYIKLFLIIIALIFLSHSATAISLEQDSLLIAANKAYKKAKKLEFKKLDSAFYLLNTSYKGFLKYGDSTKAAESLMEIGYIYGSNAKYEDSYDAYWEALLLADQIKNDKLKASIYIKIGRLYSFFKRKDIAITYLKKSLRLNKKLIKKKIIDESVLVSNYYFLTATYREMNNPELVKTYLDSCFIYFSKSQEIPLQRLLFEKANMLSQENNPVEALKSMESIEPWFLENEPVYLVLVYTYWGDMYKKIFDYNKSEVYYKLALSTSEKYHSHIDFTPLIYEKLSEVYLNNNKYDKAFESIKKSKDLDAQFFDSRSENNQPIFEIKDSYRIEKERKEKITQKQKQEQENKISSLRNIILLGTIFFISIIGIIYFKYLKSKHGAEKEIIKRNKELEIKKAQELLDVKNKELATTALKLVEKDEYLKSIKEKLKSKEINFNSKAEVNKVVKSISINNDQSWEEFKLRFISVNESFYENLTKKFPNLSQGDHKICALIKLNFSSKEMSRLLGISIESVHTVRYRLRKKMKLARAINLVEYINTL